MPQEVAPLRFAVRGARVGQDLAADPRVSVDHVRPAAPGRPQSAEAYVRASDVAAVRAAHPGVEFEAQREAAPAAGAPGYHSNAELGSALAALARRWPGHARVEQIGESVRGAPLWALELAANVRAPDAGELPVVRLVGNIHGDETVGRELLLRLARELAESFDAHPAEHPLAEARVHLLPCLNPDGFAAGSRFNANGVDLNRDFPDGAAGRDPQPETAAVRRWIAAAGARCVLSASLHGGALVASYPYDRVRAAGSTSLFDPSPYAAAPDDALLRHLAKAYARAHGRMAEQGGFPDGVTNGSDWYQMTGGLQDWEYDTFGTLSLTLEVSARKSPPGDELAGFWAENRAPLYGLLRAAGPLTRLRGRVVDADTGEPVPGARVGEPGAPPRLVAESGRFFLPRLADAPAAAACVVAAPGYRQRTLPADPEALACVRLTRETARDGWGCTRLRVIGAAAVVFLFLFG